MACFEGVFSAYNISIPNRGALLCISSGAEKQTH